MILFGTSRASFWKPLAAVWGVFGEIGGAHIAFLPFGTVFFLKLLKKYLRAHRGDAKRLPKGTQEGPKGSPKGRPMTDQK